MYLIGALMGLALCAIQVGFAAAELPQSVWLTVAFAVFEFLAAGLGLTAAGNITPPDRQDHLAE